MISERTIFETCTKYIMCIFLKNKRPFLKNIFNCCCCRWFLCEVTSSHTNHYRQWCIREDAYVKFVQDFTILFIWLFSFKVYYIGQRMMKEYGIGIMVKQYKFEFYLKLVLNATAFLFVWQFRHNKINRLCPFQIWFCEMFYHD